MFFFIFLFFIVCEKENKGGKKLPTQSCEDKGGEAGTHLRLHTVTSAIAAFEEGKSKTEARCE